MITNKTQANSISLDELARYVANNSRTGDPDLSLYDWIHNSDLDGMTVGDVIEEWDADRDD